MSTGAWRITTRSDDVDVQSDVLYLGGNAEAAMELFRDTVDPMAAIVGVELAADVVIRAVLDMSPSAVAGSER